jgi:formylglycine-generating enzyme required for sulfatase activity
VVDVREEATLTTQQKSLWSPEQFPWGLQWPPPHGAGNYAPALKVDSIFRTSPVGNFMANRHGLYDLGGNVWE